MPAELLLLAAGSGTALATGLGAVPVFLLGDRAGRLRPALCGLAAGPMTAASALVFAVLLVQSLPEGFAIGTAFAADPTGLGDFVALAVALQNVPEGISVAIPMQADGFPRAEVTAAVLTSAPQPLAALLACLLVEQITGLLAVSFAFAAGAMLALVAVELLPECRGRRARRPATAGATAGVAGTVSLGALVGV